MTTLTIRYVIAENDCGNLDASQVAQYARDLKSAIVADYPAADVDVRVNRDRSSQDGVTVTEIDGAYQVNPLTDDNAQYSLGDLEEIETHVRTLAERVFETAGA